MKFRPLHDRVVVEPLEEDEKTAGGIIIPDTAKEKPMQGKVLAAGPGARGDDGKLVALDVKKGDKVLYGKRSEEHTSELQSLMRISYAVFCLKNKSTTHSHHPLTPSH